MVLSSNQDRSQYSELLPIEVNGYYGYIDRTGAIIVQPKYHYARGFSEGLARVRLEEQWGYIG